MDAFLKLNGMKCKIILFMFNKINFHFFFPRCMGIYTDTLNIFIRVATMLAGGGGGRRK